MVKLISIHRVNVDPALSPLHMDLRHRCNSMAESLLEEGDNTYPIKLFSFNRALKDGAIKLVRYFDKGCQLEQNRP